MKTKIFENVIYDSEVNACYITVSNDPITDTYESSVDCWVDTNVEGLVVGIEVLNASRHYDLINNILLTQIPVEECVSN